MKLYLSISSILTPVYSVPEFGKSVYRVPISYVF